MLLQTMITCLSPCLAAIAQPADEENEKEQHGAGTASQGAESAEDDDSAGAAGVMLCLHATAVLDVTSFVVYKQKGCSKARCATGPRQPMGPHGTSIGHVRKVTSTGSPSSVHVKGFATPRMCIAVHVVVAPAS